MKNIQHSGNISMDDIIAAARVMRPRSMAKEFSGTMKVRKLIFTLYITS